VSYFLTAQPILTGFIWGYETRSEFSREELQPLDASDFVSVGSCANEYGAPIQSIAARQVMDAYEYTDATAKHTDCASEAV